MTTAGDGSVSTVPAYDCSSGTCVTVPIDLGPDSNILTLRFAVTGIRSKTDPTACGVTIGDQLADVTSIDVSATTPGVELVTITIPRGLAGMGELNVTLSVGGRTSNAVKIAIQ